MNQARERHGSACVDGHIYVVGGLMAGKLKRKPGVLFRVEKFDIIEIFVKTSSINVKHKFSAIFQIYIFH